MGKISISRALVELKTIGRRIEKGITDLKPLAVQVGDGVGARDGGSTSEFISDANDKYKSVVALMSRRRAVKSAIVRSNALTRVNVAGEVMTVAEAIEMKSAIRYNEALKSKLVLDFDEIVTHIETHNKNVQRRLDELLKATFQKDSSKVKPDEYAAVASPFLAKNDAKLIDPLGVRGIIDREEMYIDMFNAEIDIVLTESNARTEIDI